MMESYIQVARAQQLILANICANETIWVPPTVAYRRILANDLHACWDVPQAALSVMDGWAIRITDGLAKPLQKTLVSAAGHPTTAIVSAGTAARVSTGAVIPEGADVVLAQEEIIDLASHIRIPEQLVPELKSGRFIRPRASEIRQGQMLIPAGKWLMPGDLALICGCGHSVIPIYRPPKVALISSGDELVAIGTTPSAAQVVNSNGLMLALQIQEAGGEVVDLGIVQDDPQQLIQALQTGLQADMLITSGGISVGDHDLVYECLQSLGLQTIFRKVQLKPGKPTTFGFIDKTAIFALPGNPASSHVAFELFVRPALRKALGFAPPWLPVMRHVILQAQLEGELHRDHYVRAYVENNQAFPLEQQGSGALTSLRGHNALLAIPAGSPNVASGTVVDALMIAPETI